MNLATNADKILAARMRGMKPADMVIVSLVGPVAVINPVVQADPAETYDWRWVRDLSVCLYLNDEQDWPGILKAIALQRPASLILWNQPDQWGAEVYLIPARSDIGRPVRHWKYELDFTPWFDFQNTDFAYRRTYGRNQYGVPFQCT